MSKLKKFLATVSAIFRGHPIEVPKTSELKEGEARALVVGDLTAGGTRVLLCRVEGRLYALDSLCPHERGRMNTGKLVEGRYALCPVHSYLFDPKDGKVVRGMCRKATTLKVEERDGAATVYL